MAASYRRLADAFSDQLDGRFSAAQGGIAQLTAEHQPGDLVLSGRDHPGTVEGNHDGQRCPQNSRMTRWRRDTGFEELGGAER